MFGNNENTIKVCKCDNKTPLIFTFKFIGKEYWCPRCGYTSGMFGAGTNVPITQELEKYREELKEKTKPYLSGEVEEWKYTS